MSTAATGMKRTHRTNRALRALNYDLFRPEDLTRPAPATFHHKIRQATQPMHTAAPQASTLARARSLTSDSRLPSVAELYEMFDRYNWLYFKGKLPRVAIEYSSRMTCAGSYSPHNKCIRIGRKYHEIFPQDIEDTLKHEMIHIVHYRHDAAFKAMARRIGASVRARSHPKLRRPPKYIYVCPNCGLEYPRQKRLVLASCGDCSGGKYNERFKLKRKQVKRTAGF